VDTVAGGARDTRGGKHRTEVTEVTEGGLEERLLVDTARACVESSGLASFCAQDSGESPHAIRHRLEAYATLARCVVDLGSWSLRRVLFKHGFTLRKASVA
jgi:hypothetical protein